MSRFLFTTLVILGVALFVSAPATGQSTTYGHLRGLKTVEVLVELDQDSASCGIAKPMIETAATKTLLDNGVAVNSGPIPVLDVNVRTMYLPIHMCVSSVRVTLKDYGRPATPFYWTGSDPALVSLELDSAEAMLAGALSNYPDRVLTAVREFTQQIATHIRSANQK